MCSPAHDIAVTRRVKIIRHSEFRSCMFLFVVVVFNGTFDRIVFCITATGVTGHAVAVLRPMYCHVRFCLCLAGPRSAVGRAPDS